ncbi:MAG: hypothetical protein QOK30_3096 [Nocardioidaceae bacterium]|jgi:hypothetical protein|nr:hypothetical protein [Nocardioidaceae bacterium]
MSLDRARAVADAVLYEGYLLYPYRATSGKNSSRWQWGVLGPPGAAADGLGEEPDLSSSCLLRVGADAEVTLRLRFLQLQTRRAEAATPGDPTRFHTVEELRVGERTWLTWDEAIAHETELGPCRLADLEDGRTFDVEVPGGEDVELIGLDDSVPAGRLVRGREPLAAVVRVRAEHVDSLVRLHIDVANRADEVAVDKASAVRRSLIGTHLLLSTQGAEFVSLLEPPEGAEQAVAGCEQHRVWPVLAGEPGSADVVLVSPIILYDYPEVAEQSAGALFDSTEIDEILTLRVMTLTDEEKAAARATDPRAADIIDRCDAMSPEAMQALHGILRDPHAGVVADTLGAFGPLGPVGAGEPLDLSDVPTFSEPRTSMGGDIRNADPTSFDTGGAPWWDPAEDAAVRPEVDTVLVDGVAVGKDSLVRLQPSRRADAQDLFFAGQTARVTAVLSDVDDQVHVAVVLVDDPAADLHDWYGRYLYFAPDELEPLGPEPTATTSHQREESRP